MANKTVRKIEYILHHLGISQKEWDKLDQKTKSGLLMDATVEMWETKDD